MLGNEQNKLYKKLWRRAHYKIDTFYNPDGTAKPLDEIPSQWRCVIDSVKTRQTKTGQTIVYRLANRTEAMKALNSLLKNGEDNETAPDPLSKDAKNRLNGIFNSPETLKYMINAKTIIEMFRERYPEYSHPENLSREERFRYLKDLFNFKPIMQRGPGRPKKILPC
ncbi:MAG: hypothetical protein ACM3X9_02890 [Bacillota bacterium]